MSAQSPDCCEVPEGKGPTEPPDLGERAGRRTVLSAVVLGVVASACCWVPLALAGAGVVTGTLGARIAWIRPWALGGLLLLLIGVLAWWARKRVAATGAAEGCCLVAPKFPTLAVTILLGSFALAWASPRIIHPGRNMTLTALAPPAPTGGTILVLSTPQFDCPPCVGTLPQTMAGSPGVASIQMDFDKHETRIVFQPGAAVDATLAQWKKELGFEGKEVRRETASASAHGKTGP
jgi:hypothetical protein